MKIIKVVHVYGQRKKMARSCFVVLLTLVFYICICSGEGPTAGPVGEGSECTSGFITLDRLKLLAPVSAARHNQQIIIPGINFTCNSVITKWVVGARWEGNGWYPDLQLWRETGNGAYTKVGNTTLRVDSENTNGVYEYPVNPPLAFQAGDILGIFQPHRENSSIRINYETENGPPNYFMFARRAVEPQLGEFTIEHDTQINYDTPLVAVEISAQEDVLQCTRGFMNLERINILRPVMTRDQQQRIFPQINFTCDGNVTKWIMGANQDDSLDYYPELQIWRNSGSSTYIKVGNTPPGNAIPFLPDVTTNVYEYTPDSPLEFKSGDILGVFQPPYSLSRLRVYYGVNNGPTSFDLPVGEEDTEPPQDTFILTQPGVLTSSDLPLITVEIAVSTSQESSLFIISTATQQSPTITALGTSIHTSTPGSVHVTSTQSSRELTVLPSFISSSTTTQQSPTITTLGTSIHSSAPGSVHVTSTQPRREQTVLPPSIPSSTTTQQSPTIIALGTSIHTSTPGSVDITSTREQTVLPPSLSSSTTTQQSPTITVSMSPPSPSSSLPPSRPSPPLPPVVTDDSLPLTAIGGAVGAAVVAIAVTAVILTVFVCIVKRKSGKWTTPHVDIEESEMKENEAYGSHSDDVISTNQNEAYGTHGILTLTQNEAYIPHTIPTSQNDAYGTTNVDDGEYENYDYPRV